MKRVVIHYNYHLKWHLKWGNKIKASHITKSPPKIVEREELGSCLEDIINSSPLSNLPAITKANMILLSISKNYPHSTYKIYKEIYKSVLQVAYGGDHITN